FFCFLLFCFFVFLIFWFLGCARAAGIEKNMRSSPLLCYRPIRSSPKFAKVNSIVWMITNERVGAWMPLGRVCSIGFGNRGISWKAGQRGSQGDTSPCKTRGRSPQKAAAQRQLKQRL